MIRTIITLIILVNSIIPVLGQIDSLKKIDRIARKIDSDKKLNKKKLDAEEVYNETTDGGGIIEIYYNDAGVKKIVQEIGVSFGRLTTIIYLVENKPVKIIDREENFEWSEEQGTFDYYSLKIVYQVEIYVYNAALNKIKIISTGERNLSTGNDSLTEFYPLIEIANDLIEKK